MNINYIEEQLDISLAKVALDLTDNGVLIVDVNRKIILRNARFDVLWNVPVTLKSTDDDELLLRAVSKQLKDPQAFFENISAVYTKLNFESSEIAELKDGRMIHFIAHPMYREGEVVALIWISRDITDYGQLKDTLRNEISFRNAIIETLPDLIWLKDTDGAYLACNKRFEDFFGVPCSEIIGKTDYDFVSKELADFFREQDKKAMELGSSNINEEEITFSNDGHHELLETTKTPMYDSENKLIGVLGIGHDITKRKENEKKLKVSEERFELAMRAANDGVWDWNMLTNEVYYSPRWKSMLGYEEHELENRLETWNKLVHPDDYKLTYKNLDKYISGETNLFEVEMRMKHKKGHYIDILSRAFLVKEKDTKPTRLVGTHVDITEQKKIKSFDDNTASILKMIASGVSASTIYDEIALMYERRHEGMRCSLLELKDGKLMHGGAPSMPKAYQDAVHGLAFGPHVGSCGASTYSGKRVVVENIETDENWKDIKQFALPHGMRSCWSEPIIDSSGKVLGAFGMYYDYPSLPNEEESEDLKSAARLASIAMERDQAQNRIRQLAYSDELTGLASRAHFYQYIQGQIEKSNADMSKFLLFYVDLDDFKSVNDSLGHDVGDILLKEIARRLEHNSREGDEVARLSGDEFCILTKEITDDYHAAQLAQRYLKEVTKPMILSGRNFTPSCSIGIAYYPDDAHDLGSLLKAADIALYYAKDQGKGRYSFYKPELTQKTEYRFRMEQYLREAIESQELTLVYQPQFSVESGEMIGVEALSRWDHPILGDVSPMDFVPIAERIGMIKTHTEWVLRSACIQAVSWKKAGLKPMRMAVNISPTHFTDTNIVDIVKRILSETGMVAHELELEVTESVVQTDQRNLNIFHQLKDLGVLIAIDDFGTGYSSFASLKHFNVDCLKIDKYFIDDILEDKKTEYIVQTIIDMGHKLGFGIIAEGVETQEQFNLLKSFGCETIQGYLFSKPITAEEVQAFLPLNT